MFLKKSQNSPLAVTANEMSVESMKVGAHEMGIHVAEAALKLVTCGQESAHEELYYKIFFTCIEPNKATTRRKKERGVLRSFRILLSLRCFRSNPHPFKPQRTAHHRKPGRMVGACKAL